MKILKVNEVCKTYIVNKIQNHVLKNISFEVEEGEMVAIMGPSGGGKSTLLYTISGMDHLTAGHVELGGTDLTALSDNQLSDFRLEKMGFIFQQMYMLKNLSIYDNIILPAYQRKGGKQPLRRREINDYAKELMRRLSIMEVADNGIHEISGGQLQRACICRSLINRPQIIFADEPTGSLNQQTSKEVMKELNHINQEGTTILLVTHDSKVAAKTDRILYLQDGNIHGELNLGKFTSNQDLRDRERTLNHWLSEMGW